MSYIAYLLLTGIAAIALAWPPVIAAAHGPAAKAEVIPVVPPSPNQATPGPSVIAFGVTLHRDLGMPIPVLNQTVSAPARVRLGEYALDVSLYRVRHTLAPLSDAYRTELKARGWQLHLLPWQKHQAQVIYNLELQLRLLPDAPGAPEARALVERHYQTLELMLARQVYAQRGKERAYIQLVPFGATTEVVISSWTDGWVGSPAEGRMADAWLDQSTLCRTRVAGEGEAALRDLPIPAYPGMHFIADSRSTVGKEVSLLVALPDDIGAVTAYYTEAMRSQGWRLVDRSAKAAAGGVVRQRLVFDSLEQGNCLLSFVQRPGEATRLLAILQRP